MMKFMLSVYIDEEKISALSRQEQAELDRRSLANDRALMTSGHLIDANPLRQPATAKTVRVSGGKRSVTDGPFAETKEHLGGYLIVEAKDVAEAVEIAARTPICRFGCIEVRQIMPLG